MLELILGTLICLIVCIFYLIIRESYPRTEYILKESSNDKIKFTKIRGEYININYEGQKVRIFKEENRWYYIKNEEEKVSLRIGDCINIGNKEFTIGVRIKKGGGSVLYSLITVAMTILLLYYQGSSIINLEEENTSGDSGWTQVTDNDNLSLEEKDTEQKTEKDESTVQIVNDNEEDIHSIVSKYDKQIQNNIVIDWSSYYDMSEPSLKDPQLERGLNATQNQGDIDWTKVKAEGVDFAIIHIGSRGFGTDGNLYPDPMFKENIEQAIAQNIKVGTSFYSQATDQEEMDEEIEMMLEAVKDYKIEYPIGISLERTARNRTNILSDEEYIELIKYFYIRIKQKGYTPMIMGRTEWFEQFSENTFDNYLKLVARDGEPPIDIPNCIIWQYEENSKNTIDGIKKGIAVSVYLSGYVNIDENNN